MTTETQNVIALTAACGCAGKHYTKNNLAQIKRILTVVQQQAVADAKSVGDIGCGFSAEIGNRVFVVYTDER